MLSNTILMNAASNSEIGVAFAAFTFLGLLLAYLSIKRVITYSAEHNNILKEIFLVPILSGLSITVLWVAFTYGNLLFNYTYVEGTTIEYCIDKGNKGRTQPGIRYKYVFNGIEYVNCDFRGKMKVKIPGVYKVRLTPSDPALGLIDLEQPLGN